MVDACRMLASAILLVVLQLTVLLLVILSTHPGCPGAFVSPAHVSVSSKAVHVPEPDQVPALNDDKSKQDRDGFANFKRPPLDS
jgi:hypothetical protein